MVHFPSAEKAGGADFKELERQFQAVVANYKHVHATRIFAFGHSFEQGDYPDILDPQRDIVFPPEQEFEVRNGNRFGVVGFGCTIMALCEERSQYRR